MRSKQTVLGGDSRSLREILMTKPSKKVRNEKRRLKKEQSRSDFKAYDKEHRKGNPDYRPIIKMGTDIERERLEKAQGELQRKKRTRRNKDTDNIVSVKSGQVEPLEGFFNYGGER